MADQSTIVMDLNSGWSQEASNVDAQTRSGTLELESGMMSD